MNGSSTSPVSVLAAGAGSGVGVSLSELPTTSSGRVRKNRIASNIPQNANRVLPKRVNWYGTSEPVKYIQRATLVGIMQRMNTAG